MTVFRFVERERANHHLAALCRVLGVSPSAYRAWARGPSRRRAAADIELLAEILAIHAASRRTYGSPRVHAELRRRGIPVGRKRVARLMRQAALVGVHRRRFARPGSRPARRPATTAPDLVRRDFRAPVPDRLWVADITDLPTGEGPLHLAAILDVFSRRVVGRSMADHLRTELVLAALERALVSRAPAPGLIHHSDRGTQYTSLALGERLREVGIAPSMGAPGTAYDNALMESFFATLETELTDRSAWATRADAEAAVDDWIDRFYNPIRLHSALGYAAPDEFEGRYRSAIHAA